MPCYAVCDVYSGYRCALCSRSAYTIRQKANWPLLNEHDPPIAAWSSCLAADLGASKISLVLMLICDYEPVGWWPTTGCYYEDRTPRMIKMMDRWVVCCIQAQALHLTIHSNHNLTFIYTINTLKNAWSYCYEFFTLYKFENWLLNVFTFLRKASRKKPCASRNLLMQAVN